MMGVPNTTNDQIDTIDKSVADDMSLQTNIANVSVVPAVTVTSSFQQVLQEIPLRVAEADKLLADYRRDKEAFIETMDEDALDEQIKKMNSVSKFVREIEQSRKDIRKYMNDIRDDLIQQLDTRLEQARYGELERAKNDISQLKKDLSAERAEKRWGELRQTFEMNVNRYPLIAQFAPELADFSRFRILHPKLVSGAKTRVVREADHTMVNDIVFGWNTAIELMRENAWGLGPHDLNKLLTMFKQNPSVELVTREGRQLKINAEEQARAQKEAEERRKREAELARIEAEKRQAELLRLQQAEEQARLARDKAAQEQAERERLALEERARQAEALERQRQAEFAQFGGQYRTIFKESFPQFIEYLFANKMYHDVGSNPVTKINVIYDIMQQAAHQPNSVVAKETMRDAQKILDLIRFVMDA